MSALPAGAVEMINELSDGNTHRLVRFIEELRKEEMSPVPEEIEEYDRDGARMVVLTKSEKALERLMRYKGTLPADFDYKAELAAARSEKYENIS